MGWTPQNDCKWSESQTLNVGGTALVFQLLLTYIHIYVYKSSHQEIDF